MIEFVLYQSWRNKGKEGCVSVFWLRRYRWVACARVWEGGVDLSMCEL